MTLLTDLLNTISDESIRAKTHKLIVAGALPRRVAINLFGEINADFIMNYKIDNIPDIDIKSVIQPPAQVKQNDVIKSEREKSIIKLNNYLSLINAHSIDIYCINLDIIHLSGIIYNKELYMGLYIRVRPKKKSAGGGKSMVV